MSSTPNAVYLFDITWFADRDAFAVARDAFVKLAKRFVFQAEECPTTGNPHFQCYIKLKTKLRPLTLGKLLNDLGMNGASARPSSSAGRIALMTYAMKEESRVAGPWADRPLFFLTYNGHDLQCMRKPLPVQQAIMDMILEPPDDRSVVWIHDRVGNTGKSKLCKFLAFTKEAHIIPFGTAQQIKTAVIMMGRHRCFLIDVPRTTGKDEAISEAFSCIEALKNGYVQSAMYGKHQTLFMEPPHVICFSNVYPCKYLMSQDRWRIYNVDSTQDPPIYNVLDWECAKCAKKRYRDDCLATQRARKRRKRK